MRYNMNCAEAQAGHQFPYELYEPMHKYGEHLNRYDVIRRISSCRNRPPYKSPHNLRCSPGGRRLSGNRVESDEPLFPGKAGYLRKGDRHHEKTGFPAERSEKRAAASGFFGEPGAALQPAQSLRSFDSPHRFFALCRFYRRSTDRRPEKRTSSSDQQHACGPVQF